MATVDLIAVLMMGPIIAAEYAHLSQTPDVSVS